MSKAFGILFDINSTNVPFLVVEGGKNVDLMNCPNCRALFVKSKFRDVCDACYNEEEEKFDEVYQFIRKRSNRTATMAQVVEATDVDESLILKFIKTGRLRISQFPNLGYPCEQCGTLIRDGRICEACTKKLRTDLENLEKEEQRKREMTEQEKKVTYFVKENLRE